MERQQFLQLKDGRERAVAAREFCRERGLSPRQVSVLCLFAEQGDARIENGQSLTVCAMSKHDAGKRLTCSPNTFLGDVRDLEALGVVGVLRNTRPWTFVVNWSRIDKLEKPPDDPLAALAHLPIAQRVWSTPVSSGQEVRSVQEDSLESVNRSSVNVSTNRATGVDRPWDRETGVQDGELVASVASGRLKPLRRLYDEACRAGWIGDSIDTRLRFLTICHHAATCQGVKSRMGMLVARVKRNLDVDRIRHESEQWAAAVLRKPEAPAETSDSLEVARRLAQKVSVASGITTEGER